VDFSDEKFKNTYKMQKISQLSVSIDSLEDTYKKEINGFATNFYGRTGIKNIDKDKPKNATVFENYSTYLSNYKPNQQLQIVSQAANLINNQKKTLINQKNTFFYREKLIALHGLLLQDKYALGLIPLILFFVGAPLGAIIRKGGFGLPVVFALIIFLGYHFLGQFSKNWAEDGSINTFFGTWLPAFILLPFGVYLTIRSTADKSILNLDLVLDPIREVIQKTLVRIQSKKRKAS
jgi:lipopolysaccharide export system permease protein